MRIGHLGGFVWVPGKPNPFWSDELHRILGYEPGLVQPGAEAFFAAVHPEDVERVREAFQRVAQGVENATIVFVVCDRGDRYLSTGVFPA